MGWLTLTLTLTLTLPVPHADLGAGLLQYADNRPTYVITLVGMVAVGMVPAPPQPPTLRGTVNEYQLPHARYSAVHNYTCVTQRNRSKLSRKLRIFAAIGQNI